MSIQPYFGGLSIEALSYRVAEAGWAVDISSSRFRLHRSERRSPNSPAAHEATGWHAHGSAFKAAGMAPSGEPSLRTVSPIGDQTMTHTSIGKRPASVSSILLVAVIAAWSVRSVAAEANPTVPIPISDLIAAIDNHDIRWHGALVGLLPELRGASGLMEKHYAEMYPASCLRR